MVIPHSGSYPHAKFEGNLLLFKFEPHTKSGLTIPQCGRSLGAKCSLKLCTRKRWSGVAGCLFYLWISRFSGCPPLFPHDAAEAEHGGRHLNAAKRPKFASSPHPEQPDIRAPRMNSASHRRRRRRRAPSSSRLTCQIQDMSELCSSKIGIWRFPH